jgi:rRNA maturation RNase YbeY
MFTNFVNMASKSKVYFFFDNISFTLKDRTELKRRVERIFKNEGESLVSLNYIFCNDQKLLQINRDYLKHDYYTDIISFDLSEPGSGISGEIFISVDRVRDNAKDHNVPFSNEIRRVIFHGALHLCGYRDKTKKEAARMREKEEEYLGE